jgi:acetyl-CoA carboxylase biotin carboxyl carrier protein
MKVMNEIQSEFNGEIVEILVEDGESVEYSQPLFKFRRG